MASTKKRAKRLTGRWVHPADGEDYPDELTMQVTESGPQMSIISWSTKTTGYGEPFVGRVSEHSFTHGEGSHHILTAARRPDGTWSSVVTMAASKWSVDDGRNDTAREVLRRFFTELGYVQQEGRS